MSAAALARAREIAAAVTSNIGGQGIFGVELFIKGDDVWFSEVSPRPHDTGMVTMVSQVQNEFELSRVTSAVTIGERERFVKGPLGSPSVPREFAKSTTFSL